MVLVLFLLIVLLWLILGKVILRVLSVIPFLLKKVCWCFYLLLEMPVAFLHKKFGSNFGKIDHALLCAGEKIDNVMQSWYKAWHYPSKIHIGRLLIVYFACVIFIVLPTFVRVDNNILSSGKTTYERYETRFASWLEERGLYEPAEWHVWNQEKQDDEDMAKSKEEISKDNFEEITLVVSGVDTSLLIRDVPSIDECNVLDNLQNDDAVIWKGQLIFAKAENDHVEPWVKVTTANGAEGWCRLFYLHPDEYENKEFHVIDMEE